MLYAIILLKWISESCELYVQFDLEEGKAYLTKNNSMYQYEISRDMHRRRKH